MNALFLIILIVIDAIIYPKKRLNWFFFKWHPTLWGQTVYPVYRAFQGALDVIAGYYIFESGGKWPLIGFIAAWFLRTKEAGFYLVLGQINDVEKYVNPYWLTRPWFIGFFIDRKEFHPRLFIVIGVIGLLIAILFNI